MASISVGIAQIALHGEVFSETVEMQRFHLRGIVHATKARACGERNRACPGKNLGRVVEKHFVDDPCGKRSPVHRGSTFDQDAGDFELSQATKDGEHVRAPIGKTGRKFLDTNAELLKMR